MAGRQKGTPNKTTAFSKTIINNIVSEYQSSGKMQEDLEFLEPKDRLHVIIKLLEYITPKMQSVSAEVTTTNQATIEDKLATLAQLHD